MEKHPLIIVIAGASGDLFKRKLVPSLFSLFLDNKLGDFSVIGFSRREIRRFAFKNLLEEVVTSIASKRNIEREVIKNFIDKFEYISLDVTDINSYTNLKRELFKRDLDSGVCANKLFYFALSPNLYDSALKNIADSGLTIACAPEFGKKSAWSKILLEKPFGINQEHAISLDNLIQKYFYKDQVYKIDHYAGKRIIKNLPEIIYSNRIISDLWNHKHIESIFIRVFEQNKVGNRGAFYDSIGAIRDFGQNHLMVILSRLLAEASLEGENEDDHRKKREEILKQIKVLNVVVAQYEGYKNESGVKENSDTETYFKGELKVSNERFKGVKIVLEHGKAFNVSKAEILVNLKPSDYFGVQNSIRFSIQPEEGLSFEISFSGDEKENKIKNLEFIEKSENFEPRLYPYELMFKNILEGKDDVFLSDEEVMCGWSIAEEMLRLSKKREILTYPEGSAPDSF